MLPWYMKTIKFWDAVSWVLAGAAGILALFGVIPETWALPAATIFAAIKAILKSIEVELEIKAGTLK